MSKKKAKDTAKRSPQKEAEELSPFASIVLKEKKEPDSKGKSVPVERKKAPGEIVQGYDPNASFEDILFSFEHTGNPYTLKKSTFKGSDNFKSDFGKTLEKWERQQYEKESSSTKTQASPEKKTTRSVNEILRNVSLDEEDQAPVTIERKESIKIELRAELELSKKKKKTKEEAELKAEDALSNGIYDRPSWQVERDKSTLPPLNYVPRHKDKEEEEEDEIDIPEGERKSFPPLKPKKAKKKKDKNRPLDEKDALSYKMSVKEPWKVDGASDSDSSLPPLNMDEIKKGIKGKGQEKPKDSEDFASILNGYEGGLHEKTFDEILKEKGDLSKETKKYTINELRKMSPQSTLDLHGETQKEAEVLVRAFIEEAMAHHLRKVSINVGKGLHSENHHGVLADKTRSLLQEMKVATEINNAPQNMGGSGVLWIILKEE